MSFSAPDWLPSLWASYSSDIPYVDKTNWITNLISGYLNDAEIAQLKKGLNFVVTPAHIPASKIIAKVESATRQPNAEQADTVWLALNNNFQQAEPPEPNIAREMQDALKRLKEDKERPSVVMDTDTYHTKKSTLIENGACQLRNKDLDRQNLWPGSCPNSC